MTAPGTDDSLSLAAVALAAKERAALTAEETLTLLLQNIADPRLYEAHIRTVQNLEDFRGGEWDEVCRQYAEELGLPELTVEERRAAWLEAVLREAE
jgi:hypothetical protein